MSSKKSDKPSHKIEVDGFSPSIKVKAMLSDLFDVLIQARLLAPGIVVLSVSAVSKSKMKSLNAKYRRKNKVTDILSFEQPGHSPRGVHFLGDLVLCLDVVRAQAREQKHTVKDELSVLFVHGVLHLLGFDHEKGPSAEKKMRSMESRILKKWLGPKAPVAGLIARTRLETV